MCHCRPVCTGVRQHRCNAHQLVAGAPLHSVRGQVQPLGPVCWCWGCRAAERSSGCSPGSRQQRRWRQRCSSAPCSCKWQLLCAKGRSNKRLLWSQQRLLRPNPECGRGQLCRTARCCHWLLCRRHVLLGSGMPSGTKQLLFASSMFDLHITGGSACACGHFVLHCRMKCGLRCVSRLSVFQTVWRLDGGSVSNSLAVRVEGGW